MSAEVLFAVDTAILASLVASDVHPHYPISHSRRDLWDPNDNRSRGRIGTAALVEKDCLPCDGMRVALALHRGAYGAMAHGLRPGRRPESAPDGWIWRGALGRWMTCVCVGVGVGDGAMRSMPPHGASLLGPSRADRPRRAASTRHLALPSQQSALSSCCGFSNNLPKTWSSCLDSDGVSVRPEGTASWL